MHPTSCLTGTVLNAGGESVLGNVLQSHKPLEGHTLGRNITTFKQQPYWYNIPEYLKGDYARTRASDFKHLPAVILTKYHKIF